MRILELGLTTGLAGQFEDEIQGGQSRRAPPKSLAGDALHQVPHHGPTGKPLWNHQSEPGRRAGLPVLWPPMQIEKATPDNPAELKNG